MNDIDKKFICTNCGEKSSQQADVCPHCAATPSVLSQDHPTQQNKQLEVIECFGTIEYDPDYDYKKQRARK